MSLIREVTMTSARVANPDYITRIEYMKALRGMQAANLSGLVLNGHATVSWQTLGLEIDEEVEAAHLQFRSLLDHWLRKRQLPTVYI